MSLDKFLAFYPFILFIFILQKHLSIQIYLIFSFPMLLLKPFFIILSCMVALFSHGSHQITSAIEKPAEILLVVTNYPKLGSLFCFFSAFYSIYASFLDLLHFWNYVKHGGWNIHWDDMWFFRDCIDLSTIFCKMKHKVLWVNIQNKWPIWVRYILW